MKKTFFLFLFIGLYTISIAQEFEILNKWNFLGVVSKTISKIKASTDSTIARLVTVRRYEKEGTIAKLTMEETKYIIEGECWSRIKITGYLEDRPGKIGSLQKDTLPKQQGNLAVKFLRLKLIKPEQKQEANEISVDIHVLNPISIIENTPNAIVFHTPHGTCDITRENLRNIRTSLTSVHGIDLMTSNDRIFINRVGFLTFEDDLKRSEIAPLSSRQRRKLWAAANYTPQVAFGRVLIDEASFGDQTEVDRRTEQSRPIYGYNAGLSVGWWLDSKNRFSLNFGYAQMGFESKNSAIDWTTGYLDKETTTSSLYHFKFWQAGINYAYVHNSLRRVNVIVDLGLSVNWKKHFEQNKTVIATDSGFKKVSLVGSLGVGANINIAKWLDLELVPTAAYTFTSVHTQKLKTRLHTVGITSRFVFNFSNK